MLLILLLLEISFIISSYLRRNGRNANFTDNSVLIPYSHVIDITINSIAVRLTEIMENKRHTKERRKLADNLINQYLNETNRPSYFKNVRYSFAYDNEVFRKNSTYPYLSLNEAIEKYKVDNSILLMFTNYGFINQFRNTYIASKLMNYKNLIVVCIDKRAYEVSY